METTIQENEFINKDNSVHDVINLLMEKDVSQDLSNRLYQIIESDATRLKVLSFLTSKYTDCRKGTNFSSRTAKMIIDQSIEDRCYRQLENITLFPENRIEFDSLGISGNLLHKVKELGFTENFIAEVWNLREPKGGVATGLGEIFMSLILRHGNNPINGDIAIGATEIEMKSTSKSKTKQSGFRLRGQQGYGIGNRAGIHVFDAIRAKCKLHDIVGPDISIGKNEQLYFKSKESLADHYFSQLVSNKAIELNEIADIYAKSMQFVYSDADLSDLQSIFHKTIKSDGKLNIEEFLIQLAVFEIKYYQSIEHWAYIVCVNYLYDYVIIKNDQMDLLEDIVRTNFYILSPPRTTHTATSQDSVCALRLK
jgi:hypothetical protein